MPFINGQVPSDGTTNIILYDIPCDASTYVSGFVRMTAGGLAVNALADSETNSNIIGMVILKPTSTTCNIRVTGVSEELFAGLDVTKEYYLSSTVPGGISTIPPTGTGEILLKVGQPFSDKKFFVLKGTRVIRK